MKNTDLSFLVVGAGAIGGITAAFLKKNGCSVEVVCKYNDYADLISRHGIEVKGVHGEFRVAVPAYPNISDVTEKKDIVLLATKATDMIVAARAIKGVLKPKGLVISMQNGICEDDLAAVLGRERVIGCVTGWGATMEAQGKLIMTSTGEFVLGYLDKEPDSLLLSVGEVLSNIVPVKTTANIMGHLYSKLIISSCITSLGAICGLYLGKMLSLSKVRRIFIEIIKEAVEVADKMKIDIEVFGGRLDFRKFVKGNDLFSVLRRHLVIMIVGFRFRKLKSSSLQSLERGKLTEVDYFNGYIVKNGLHHGVAVPVNSEIIKMIHEIESGKRSISAANFNDPAFDRFNA